MTFDEILSKAHITTIKMLEQKMEQAEKAVEKKIKALEQEPYICDTCKNKENGWDTEPCDSYCGNHSGYEPCDAISRQAVLDITWEEPSYTDALNVLTEVRDKVKALPSVRPQKSGKWIEKDGYDGDVYYDCSVCGESWTTIEGTPWDNEWKYCPNCGAKMGSEDKE